MAKRGTPTKKEVQPENPYQYFTIYHLSNIKDRKKIEQRFVGKGALNLVPYALLDYILTPNTKTSKPSCETVLVEERYRDKDHSKALSNYYAKSFRQVSSECVRLHFFSRRYSIINIDDISAKLLEKSYMGFCVLRPFAQRKTGRTVLKRINFRPALDFPTCHGNFEVNIAGSKLTFEGTAFMEQDTMVAACASTAIWMSTTTMGARFGLNQRSTSEITQLASQHTNQTRPMPSEGLAADQMVSCLCSMNYEPILVGVTDQAQAKHNIYSYIESEIPPILLCELATGGLHTIVGVGHGYKTPIRKPTLTSVGWPGEQPLIFARSSEWVPNLLIHDDQRGPFRKLTFIDSGTNKEKLKQRIKTAHPFVKLDDLELDEWNCPIAIDLNMPSLNIVKGEQIANIWGAIIPLPPNVILTVEQAEQKSARLISLWHWWKSTPTPKNLVLRTYLVPSNEYKARTKNSGMHPFVKSLIKGKPMPRWVWVTEISSTKSYNSPKASNWIINGQIIIDATSNAFTPDFLLFHYIVNGRGILSTMTPEHDDAEQALSKLWVSKKDFGYTGWVR